MAATAVRIEGMRGSGLWGLPRYKREPEAIRVEGVLRCQLDGNASKSVTCVTLWVPALPICEPSPRYLGDGIAG